ncbi:MAG: peptidoglycan DD-metalloendopeptidase family protein, partial [Alphaproteobacteria bacterium]|nr:peptidoglycan DD-metalloendopeptidase family protein [Alphaproteobacteria bacterium]
MPRDEPRRQAQLAAAVVATLLLAPDTGFAQDTGGDPRRTLDAVERALEEGEARGAALDRESSAVANDISVIREQLIAAAAAVQRQESRLQDSETALADLEARRAEAEASFERHRAGLESALAALTLVARSPPSALLARPAEWADTVRGVVLLDTLVPELQRRSSALAGELKTLDELRIAHTLARAELADANAHHDAEQARLRGLLERKSSLQAAMRAERRDLAAEMAVLAAEAEDLASLLERIAVEQARSEARLAEQASGLDTLDEPSTLVLAEPNAGPALAPQLILPRPPDEPPDEPPETELAALPAAPGSSLPYPAHGEVVEHFGDPLVGGGASLGIRISVRAGAQVVAPREGSVVFAGPFRSYGQLLIVQHAGGYHTL